MGNVWAVKFSFEDSGSGNGWTELSSNGNGAATAGHVQSPNCTGGSVGGCDFATLGQAYPHGTQLTITNPANGRSGTFPLTDVGNGSSFAPAIGLTPTPVGALGISSSQDTVHISLANGGDLNVASGFGTLVSGAGGAGGAGGGTAGLGGTGTTVNPVPASPWAVGDTSNPDEDYWTAINRLAQDAQWYCLALDTPIPTPSGWASLGELRVGDLVFGSNGHPTPVTGVTPTYYDRDCFRVEFKDGSTIVADADHLWLTSSLYRDQAARTQVRDRWIGLRTTREIADSVYRNGYKVYNHQIGVTAPLALPATNVPIDPYIFGYWLGDGSKTGPSIVVGREDRAALVGEIARAGLQITSTREWPDGGADLYFSTGERGAFLKSLRALGVYDNKHIPQCYLRSSVEQRLALLQGLMDSDGSVDHRRASFSNVNTRLADDVRELLRTFGARAYRHVTPGGKRIRMPRGHTSVAKDLIGIAFATSPSLAPFRLGRKRRRYEEQLAGLKGAQHNSAHTIKAVTPVPSVSVRCVQVGAEDRLFLAGEAMVPTHNCFADGETLYVADGTLLMQQAPVKVINRLAPEVLSLDFTWDNPLALDTLIPTPSGWTTMGELRSGEEVFGVDGRPVRVLRTSPIFLDRECFCVKFSDGVSIVADGSHLWETIACRSDGRAVARVAPQRYLGIRSTQEIRDTLNVSVSFRAPFHNHRVRMARALELPGRELPIDPYVFGYWLGDGDSQVPSIYVSDEDAPSLLREVDRAGYSYRTTSQEGGGFGGVATSHRVALSLFPEYRRASKSEDNLSRRLRALGVLGNKHIPSAYLRASLAQRLALLQGLMDSDGSVGRECALAFADETLALDAAELIRSLGYRIRPPRRQALGRNGSRPLYRMSFATRDELNCFRLPRKAQRYTQRLATKSIRARRKYRTIVDVEPVPSVPVRCIEVDAEDHLFLAGEGMVPTRNTAFNYASHHKRRGHIQRKSTLAKVVSPVEANLELICEIDEIRAGDVVQVIGTGPGDGLWLIGNATRSVFQIYSTLTLVPALAPINAAAGVGTTASAPTVTKPSGGGAAASGFVNPFPGGWNPSRLDMGYDGTFKGQIVAPFAGTVTYAAALFSNWGGYVNLKADGGAIAGLRTDTLYFAEGLVPMQVSGAHVNAGDPIAAAAYNHFNGIVGNIEFGPAQSGVTGSPTDPQAKVVSDPATMVLAFAAWAQRTLGLPAPAATDHAGAP